MKHFYLFSVFLVAFNFTLFSQVSTIPDSSTNSNLKTSSEILPIDSIDYYLLVADELDSLLNFWFKSNSSKIINFHPAKPVTAYADSLMDSIYTYRLSKIPSLIPMTYNSVVKQYIEMYAVKKKNFSGRILGLTKIYYPLFEEVLDRYNMPLELKNLAIVESALNPSATSRVGASGLWQFMYSTGRMYGLEVNTFIDDRRDPVKSTVAAALHLRDLYNIYQDWSLALAAYNCGPGNVNKAIRRSGGKTNFWEIYAFLPKETRGYIPAFIAATYTMTYYNEHGIIPIEPEFPTITDTVMVNKELHLQQVSAVLKIPIELLEKLNPQYKRNIIPAINSSLPLVLPYHFSLAFEEFRDSIHAYNYDTYLASFKIINYDPNAIENNTKSGDKKYHIVKQGESLASLSKKYGLSASEIKYMNKLKSGTIHKGQKLIVGYYPIKTTKDNVPQNSLKVDSQLVKINNPIVLDSALANKIKTNVSNESPKQIHKKPTTYKVNYGDTLYSIARKYPGITHQDIVDYNKLGDNPQIKAGQVLKIPPVAN